MKKIATGLFLILCLTSCVQFRGIGDDYNHLTSEQKKMVKSFNKEEPLMRDYVYKLNAATLLEELKNYPKAFVYVTNISCGADICLPLTVYESYAKKNEYKVFFVLTGYNDLELAFAEPIKEPLFVIDSDYYEKKLFRKYVGYFKNELMGKNKKAKRTSYEGLLFYENGIFKASYYSLPSTKN